MPERADPTVFALRGLRKDFGTARVVNDVHLEFPAGTIHALLGENGAGKSTLIRMLAGVLPADAGHLEIDGVVRHPRSVAEAQSLGIVALPQELSLVPSLGAAENIFLGLRRPGRFGLVDRSQMDQDAASILARLGQTIPLRTPISELSAVQQTMVALARALAREARLLILDEPTAALTDTETVQLFAVLRELRSAGTSIVYISHRLDEVFQLADTVSVMRGGSLVWTKPVAETHTHDVVAAMIGRAQNEIYPRRAGTAGVPLLQITNLHGHRLQGVSLTASRGRVLGIAGLAGSGRSELVKIIAGAEAKTGGQITVDDAAHPGHSVKRAMAAGIALVPEERRSQGLIMAESISSNIALANLTALSRWGVASARQEKAMATRGVARLRITAASVAQPVNELSGGNQQKVVLARYLERNPRVLLLDEPTRGIDVGTKAEIYALIRALADDGVAVIVVSSDIPELLGLADEIAVLHEGRLTAVVAAADSDESSILHHCYWRAE
ncbi:sugar ABC transporter ATP-binding protein [Glaciibacter psychrotolerans]|uniref:Ribose transport system ATP-binding protein/rhamnose transport system ATP-binding protein n=1 Tax=Glaciibacter psychrotolerans TaxID=670054 RepID=A0A7Z0ECE0_9MICO|nr:sugar ABC transporter ATP-binding protein [Leifsonia psychrotolerans]NYJ18347.1 ribose transport system ATP-binding protein/rhamnose transport system ATP-binding protein [Leifsonia psychrotolerans]